MKYYFFCAVIFVGFVTATAQQITKISSTTPPLRWEDAMLSGNGSTGIMVMGLPLEDLIIVNHEKLWVVGNDYRPHTPEMAESWTEAMKIAQEGRYLDADMFIGEEASRKNKEMYGENWKGGRPRYDRTHPGFHLHINTESNGNVRNYRRETNLETGEISVFWTDNRGEWERKVFVSRTDDVIVMEMTAPTGSLINASIRLTEAPGKLAGDMKSVDIRHEGDELYFKGTYGRLQGRKKAEGYQALGQVVVTGGQVRSVENERLDILNADKLVLKMRFEYLDVAENDNKKGLQEAVRRISDDYDALLEVHAKVHGEMFNRVSLDLDGKQNDIISNEDLIKRASGGESLSSFFERLHAMGRYALICGGTGELAPSLMGLWGNAWNPPWDGRYTFDANLNLAMAAVAQGNLPEVTKTYANFLSLNMDEWRDNAQRLYGCDGAVSDLCQGWRHGAVLMPTYPWTGGVGWLAAYLYDYYLFTQDKEFLRNTAVPMLKDAADFYVDFLQKYPEVNGHLTFYPSISPENEPNMEPQSQTTNVVPNATGEIAICKEVLNTLLNSYEVLGIRNDEIVKYRDVLTKLPDYIINEDGALAEWAYPGFGDNYNHRHASHLYPVYPGLEISPERTPDLYDAAKMAMEKRLEAGLGNNSAHGFMHISLVAARLRNDDLMRTMLVKFASLPFVNSSFITCHNPGPRIYNLDATFSLPAVMTEMLVYSEPGLIEILPSTPLDQFPKGTLKGLLARGGFEIVFLHWNDALGNIEVQLKSKTKQTIQFQLGPNMRFVNAAKPEQRSLVSGSNYGPWTIELPAGETVYLSCRL